MMEFIKSIAESLNVETNTILISFLIAGLAIVCIVAVVIVMIIVSARNNAMKRQSLNYYRQKKQKDAVQQPQAQVPPPAQQAHIEQPYQPAQTTPNLQPAVNPAPAPVAPTYAPPATPVASEQPHVVQESAAPIQVSAPTHPVTPEPAPIPVQAPESSSSSAVNPNVAFSQSNVPAQIPHPESNAEHLSAVVDLLAETKGRQEDPKKKDKKKKPIKTSKNEKKAAKALKKRAQKLVIPKTVQDTIPYVRVYPDSGIIEIEDGVFTKSYLLDDINYSVAKPKEQEDMFLKYAEFMNAFDTSTKFQITINQNNMNVEEFEADTLLPMKNDGLDHLRKEQNEMLRTKIREGKNGMVKDKYLTISTKADDYESALTAFTRLEGEVTENIKKIGGAGLHPLSTAQRLEILHDIYNPENVGMFGNNMTWDKNGNLVFAKEKFRFDIMKRMGLSSKDMIGPESFSFKSNFGMVGQKYFRALFMRTVPSSVKDDFLKDLTDMEANMLTSLIYQPIDMKTALKMTKNEINNVNTNLGEKQKRASKDGISPELISPELRDAAAEAYALRDDLTHKNQKLFYLTLVIVHFADTKEQLDSDTKSIQAIGQRHLAEIKNLSVQQENGLASVLPLCNNKLQIKRSLTTEGCAVFMPFVNQELMDRDGGMYYGINAVSNNLILLDRRKSKNGNGFIFGTPGSGKSMSGKQEMMGVLLSSEDDVIVIDPEGEYYPMAEMLGGEVIRIAPGSGVHINPFDIDLNMPTEDDPITMKADFISAICETIVGQRYGLTPGQRSLIDRCVKKVYEPYLASLDRKTGRYDQSKLPTLHDFYRELKMDIGFDAKNLADGLELYVTGSQNLFAYQTNVEYTKRFVVYDIKEIGASMKSLGLLVVLDNIWNRIVAGRNVGKHVWFYIDEIYLLFKNEQSAEFLRNLYKRARKYGGIPTGITQNVSDLLENPTARTMISNCEFIQMLNQAMMDRSQLGELLSISPTQLSYVTNASPGHGLIYNGDIIVPFENKLSKDSKQYEAMTTKLSEVKAREDKKKEEQRARAEKALVAETGGISDAPQQEVNS